MSDPKAERPVRLGLGQQGEMREESWGFPLNGIYVVYTHREYTESRKEHHDPEAVWYDPKAVCSDLGAA